MSKTATTLVFNDCCGMCRSLASQVGSASHGKISMVPLKSEQAEVLLKPFYPDGHVFGYFLIEENNGRSKVWHGTRAALRLSKHLSISDSARVLRSYLSFRALGYRNATKNLKEQARLTANQTLRQRREMLRLTLIGGVALAVGSILPRFPTVADSRISLPKRSGAKEHTLPPIKLDKSMLIDGKMPKHLVISPQGQVLEAYNEDRPIPTSPDCLCFPCACCGQSPNCCVCGYSGEQNLCYYECSGCDGNLYLDGTTGQPCDLGCCYSG